MERDGDKFEVVHVIREFRLVDADSCERVYWRRDGAALAKGYYVVSWPARARTRIFNEDARFRGPFRNRHDAQHRLQQLLAGSAARRCNPPARTGSDMGADAVVRRPTP
ncbi:MAG TPA: hypothetical protein VNF69_08570 [Burkholderiales bacterium]|nr:hypothetical protein [Burkholderiales bacterium]